MRSTNVKAFFNFIQEREMIRLRKEAGLTFPWTEDKILQAYKFTHVHRIYDRTTQAFKAIYDEHAGEPLAEQLFNCGVYRWFGTAEFAREVGWCNLDDWKHIRSTAHKMLKNGRKVFTGAYIITSGGVKGPKEDYVAKLLKNFSGHCEDLVAVAENTNSWAEVYNRLHALDGFGGSGFMCKEVLLDAMLTPVLCDASDRMSWTPVGPGGRRGLNRIWGADLNERQTEQRWLEMTRELHAAVSEDWEAFRKAAPKYLTKKARPILPLAVTDVQFQLCEFDKWMRVKSGQGRPRSKYEPCPF